MNVSANIIRFPSASALVARPVEPRTKVDNVVEFPDADNDADNRGVNPDLQSHGQMFAAERIVARVNAQLESIAAL